MKNFIEAPLSKSTEDALEAGGTATKAVTQIANVLSSGSPTGISAAVSGKIFSNIKYFNITYSIELEQALATWKSNFISLGFSVDTPDWIENKIVNQPVPYMFEKREISSSFLRNFWQNLTMIILISGVLIIISLINCLFTKIKNKLIPASFVRVAKVTVQNFLLNQLYGVYGEIVLLSLLEWRSINFSQGITGLSFTFALIFLCLMFVSLGFHILLLRKYQRIRKQCTVLKSDQMLTNFNQAHKGSQVLFRDFKDQTIIQQAFLLFFTLRDIMISLTLITLFEHPLVQTILILLLNIIMFAYLIMKAPYKNNFDAAQQIFYEFVSLVVNITILIMAMFDRVSASATGMRKDMGKLIIIINFIFNFATLLFIIVKLFLEAKEAYFNYKKKTRNRKKNFVNILDSSLGNNSTSNLNSSSVIPTNKIFDTITPPFTKPFLGDLSRKTSVQSQPLTYKRNLLHPNSKNEKIVVQNLENLSSNFNDSQSSILIQNLDLDLRARENSSFSASSPNDHNETRVKLQEETKNPSFDSWKHLPTQDTNDPYKKEIHVDSQLIRRVGLYSVMKKLSKKKKNSLE